MQSSSWYRLSRCNNFFTTVKLFQIGVGGKSWITIHLQKNNCYDVIRTKHFPRWNGKVTSHNASKKSKQVKTGALSLNGVTLTNKSSLFPYNT